MGFYIHLIIESKDFFLLRDGSFLRIIEKGRKFLHVMGYDELACTLFGDLSRDDFAKTREGSSSFIVLRCSNSNGSFVVLEEYGEGGRRGSIIIPEEEGRKGWQ